MLRGKIIYIITLIASSLILSPFTNIYAGQDGEKVRVIVTVEILKSIISPIVNGVGEVHSIISGEVDPHNFMLTPSIIKEAERADIIVITGHMMWEKDLVEKVAEERELPEESISLNLLDLNGIKILDLNGERNVHGFWLLPDNALTIAEAVKNRILEIKPEFSQKILENYLLFEKDVHAFKSFLSGLSERHNLINKSVVIGFYAEHYVAEAMGLKVEAALIGEGEYVRPESLRSIYEGFRTERFSCIIVSENALLMENVQSAIREISGETGCPIAYVIAVSSDGLEKYDAIMYYNAGQVYNALLSRKGSSASGFNIYLLAALTFLFIIVFETILLVKERSKL
ncbi:MAG: zinc ABC transporter substrate-binding protein [Candidatus Bathyarchaeia archaeon]